MKTTKNRTIIVLFGQKVWPIRWLLVLRRSFGASAHLIWLWLGVLVLLMESAHSPLISPAERQTAADLLVKLRLGRDWIAILPVTVVVMSVIDRVIRLIDTLRPGED